MVFKRGHNVPPLAAGAQKKPGLDRVNTLDIRQEMANCIRNGQLRSWIIIFLVKTLFIRSVEKPFFEETMLMIIFFTAHPLSCCITV